LARSVRQHLADHHPLLECFCTCPKQRINPLLELEQITVADELSIWQTADKRKHLGEGSAASSLFIIVIFDHTLPASDSLPSTS
jgi:hypothetical protein